MQYLITFLEGIVSFISPCMLPLLPVYISYFAIGADKKRKTLLNSLCFVLGFTLVFTSLGLFAGALGAFLFKYKTLVNIVSGLIVITFGLSTLEILKLPFFHGVHKHIEVRNAFSSFLFGIIYSISHTPCAGAFLGSALMLAGTSGGVVMGTLLLLSYSLGLGIPFILSSILIDRLSSAFDFIKKHYNIVKLISGIFLIIVGISMMLGFMSKLLSHF